MKGGKNMDLQERIKRLERLFLVLCVTVLLLGVFGIALTLRVRHLISILSFFAERINSIGQVIDSIANSIG